MAKKKIKLDLGKLLLALAAVLGIVAIIMLCAPGATYELLDETESYSLAQLTFGYTAKTTVPVIGTTVETEILKFSFGNLLPYIFAVIGIVFAVIGILGKLGKIAPLVAAVAFVAAAVLFFCAVSMCAPATDNADAIATFKENLTLGAGAIVGGVLAILSALASAVGAFLKK